MVFISGPFFLRYDQEEDKRRLYYCFAHPRWFPADLLRFILLASRKNGNS